MGISVTKLLWLMVSLSNLISLHAVAIQEASLDMLDQLVAIDREVSFEYFLPKFPQMFAGSWIGDHPQESLENDLVSDRESFTKVINQKDNAYLLAALDEHDNRVIGFLWFTKNDETIALELLMVLKPYRTHGTGTQLVMAAINYFKTTQQCTAETHRNYNDGTKNFYEKIGFINQGPTPRHVELSGGIFTDQVLDLYVYHVRK